MAMQPDNIYEQSGETSGADLVPVPYDEDFEEAFTGPQFSHGDFTEEDEIDESYDDGYEAETAAIFRDQEPMASQAVVTSGGVSAYTQLGAVPGSSMLQEGLPGYRELQPEDPTQANNAEFASSGDDGPQPGQPSKHDIYIYNN